jgi:hypothetical protein
MHVPEVKLTYSFLQSYVVARFDVLLLDEVLKNLEMSNLKVRLMCTYKW